MSSKGVSIETGCTAARNGRTEKISEPYLYIKKIVAAERLKNKMYMSWNGLEFEENALILRIITL